MKPAELKPQVAPSLTEVGVVVVSAAVCTPVCIIANPLAATTCTVKLAAFMTALGIANKAIVNERKTK